MVFSSSTNSRILSSKPILDSSPLTYPGHNIFALLRCRRTLHSPRRPHGETCRRQPSRRPCRHIVIKHIPSPATHRARPATIHRARPVAYQTRLALQQGRRAPALPAVLEPKDCIGASGGRIHDGGIGGRERGDAEFGGHVVGIEELFAPGFGGWVDGFGITPEGVEAGCSGSGGGWRGGYEASCGGCG